MFVWATRQASILGLRALFYVSLFAFVVALHVGVMSGLRTQGWSPGLAMSVSGFLVLAVVLAANHGAEIVRRRRARARLEEARKLGLPEGACCVVWRPGAGEAEMPWDLVTPIRAPYPQLARRLGVEGVAVVDFEIGADGAPRHIACVDAWPSDIFFNAASSALKDARFVIKEGHKARFGVSYRMPFVFRINGMARLKDPGRKALPHRPALFAAVKAVDQLRKRA